MEENEQASSGETQEFVSIPEASEADIQAFLDKNAGITETETDEVETENLEARQQKETPEPESTEETKDFVSPKDLPDAVPSKADYDRLRSQFAQQEQFLQRRNKDVGELRKKLKEVTDHLKGNLEDRIAEDPKGAIDQALQIKENEEKLKVLEKEENELNHRQRATQILNTYLKPEDMDLEAVAESLQSDGIPAQYVQAFKADPLGQAQPDALVHLFKRARAEKALKQLAPLVKQLVEENKALKGKPQAVLQNVQNA